MATTDNFFGKRNKEERVQKRARRRGERAKERAVRKDLRKGISAEQRTEMQKAEIAKLQAETAQDQAVATIAQSLPTDSPPAKNNAMMWFVLILVLLIVVAVLVFFLF